jgi:enoyl-CoA hydratase
MATSMSEDAPGGDCVTNGAVLVERRGTVLVITLNRPTVMNAINADVATGIARGIELLDSDDSLQVGVFTGAGGVFSSGMDLTAFSRGEAIPFFEEFLIHGARKPLIAAVEGLALAGGLEIALTCDLIVAAKGAQLGIPEVKVGLFAAGGGIIRLARRLGYSKAMEMALTGDPIRAETAEQLGLIVRLVDQGKALEEAVALALHISDNAPLAVATSKYLVNASFGRTESEYWSVQSSEFPKVFGSKDAREGPTAFAERRRPHWTGA